MLVCDSAYISSVMRLGSVGFAVWLILKMTYQAYHQIIIIRHLIIIKFLLAPLF